MRKNQNLFKYFIYPFFIMAEDEYKDEEDVYGDSREDLIENDELSPEEEAFMQGYDKAAEEDQEKEEEEEKESKE